MSPAELLPNDPNAKDATSTEVQFALVIARILETVKNDPEYMRQVVYDLARHKLQEQFTHADAGDVRRLQDALEAAINGVVSNAIRNCPLCVMKNCPHHRDYDLG